MRRSIALSSTVSSQTPPDSWYHPTPVEWVEDWIEQTADGFPDVTFVIDEHQLVGTIQKIAQRYPVERFDFAAGRGTHRLAILLRQLIVHRRVAWYPGCGDVLGPTASGGYNPPDAASGRCPPTDASHIGPATTGPRDDLETELASLLLRQSENGRLRIDHHRDGVHHDDRGCALGAACLTLSERTTGPEPWTITLPSASGGFRW